MIIERTTATGGATEAQETKNWNIRGCQQQRYWRNNNYYKISSKSHLILFNNILKWPQLYSNRFLWTTKPYAKAADKFYFFFAALEKSFAAFKNILELEERAKRNLEFSKWIKRKRRGPQRNLVDVSLVYVIYPMFQLNFIIRAFWKLKNQKRFLLRPITTYFCPNI